MHLYVIIIIIIITLKNSILTDFSDVIFIISFGAYTMMESDMCSLLSSCMTIVIAITRVSFQFQSRCVFPAYPLQTKDGGWWEYVDKNFKSNFLQNRKKLAIFFSVLFHHRLAMHNFWKQVMAWPQELTWHHQWPLLLTWFNFNPSMDK